MFTTDCSSGEYRCLWAIGQRSKTARLERSSSTDRSTYLTAFDNNSNKIIDSLAINSVATYITCTVTVCVKFAYSMQVYYHLYKLYV